MYTKEELVRKVEEKVGMAHTAWDMVNPYDIIMASHLAVRKDFTMERVTQDIRKRWPIRNSKEVRKEIRNLIDYLRYLRED